MKRGERRQYGRDQEEGERKEDVRKRQRGRQEKGDRGREGAVGERRQGGKRVSRLVFVWCKMTAGPLFLYRVLQG